MRSSIYNSWNYNHLSGFDKFGLYWDCIKIPDLHRLFKVPFEELMNITYVLTKEMNISYTDINNMHFFEILMLLDIYTKNMKEQQKQNEMENKRMEKQMSSMQNKYDYSKLQKQMSGNNNNFGNMSNINMPKFDMPKFN